uniref:Uncharacterized protein n=1 Tax=Tetranychus urticae TaxID=32264 RepID=T1K2W3_TETUR
MTTNEPKVITPTDHESESLVDQDNSEINQLNHVSNNDNNGEETSVVISNTEDNTSEDKSLTNNEDKPSDNGSTVSNDDNQVAVNLEDTSNAGPEIDLKLTFIGILVNQPLLKPIYRLLTKRTGRLRIQRIVYFMGTFAITHSFLMLISVLPSAGLVDSFGSRLDFMKFTLFLNDVTLFTMLNGILAREPPLNQLDSIWQTLYSPSADQPTKDNIEIKQWVSDRVKSVRKRLYLLIVLSTVIYFQLLITIALDSTSSILSPITLVDMVHIIVDLIGLLIVHLLVYQFLISTILAQSIFRDINNSFREDKRIQSSSLSNHHPSSSPLHSTTLARTDKSEDIILYRRYRYCNTIEFIRTANNHWKHFLALFILFNFVPSVFQLHFVLNKQLDGQQLVELIYRFLINIAATYLIIINVTQVNLLSNQFYDDLYQLTLKETNDPTRLEALLFLDRVDHGEVGFTLSDSFLITPNFTSILFISLIVLVFILPTIA